MTTEVLYKANAAIPDTIDLIAKMIRDHYNTKFVTDLVNETLGPNTRDEVFIRRVFDFVADNITYIDDPTRTGEDGHESVWQPATTISQKQGDCKKMTVLIGCILKNATIEPLLKHVFYDDEDFTHIYIIVPWPQLPKYLVVDPVNDKKYNKEVRYSHGSVFDLKGNKMNLYMGNKPTSGTGRYGFKSGFGLPVTQIDMDLYGSARGIAGTSQEDQDNILEDLFSSDGNATMGKKTKEERKARREKAKQVFKGVSLAIPRGAFLVLVDFNALKLADKLTLGYVRDAKSVGDFWEKVGGNVNELVKAMKHGAGKRTSGPGMGIVVAATIATAIATATPIIIAATELLKKLKAAGDQQEQERTDDAIDEGTEHVAFGKVKLDKDATNVQDAQRRADSGGTIPPVAPTAPGTPTAGGDIFTIQTLCTWSGYLNFQVKQGLYLLPLYNYFPIIAPIIINVAVLAAMTIYTFKKRLQHGKIRIHRAR